MLDRIRSRLTYANVMVTLLAVVVVGGGAIAIGGVTDNQGRIQACYDKKGKNRGEVRLLVKGKCTGKEKKITWSQQGPPGPAGSPDTSQQVLEKLNQVDGSGSGLDADTLDGLGSDQFVRSTQLLTGGPADQRSTTQDLILAIPTLGIELQTDGDADQDNSLRVLNVNPTGGRAIQLWHGQDLHNASRLVPGNSTGVAPGSSGAGGTGFATNAGSVPMAVEGEATGAVASCMFSVFATSPGAVWCTAITTARP